MRSVTATITTYPPGRHGTPKRTRFDPLNVLECTPQTLKEPLHGTTKVRPLRGDDGAILASPMAEIRRFSPIAEEVGRRRMRGEPSLLLLLLPPLSSGWVSARGVWCQGRVVHCKAALGSCPSVSKKPLRKTKIETLFGQWGKRV